MPFWLLRGFQGTRGQRNWAWSLTKWFWALNGAYEAAYDVGAGLVGVVF
jgi:hypothetical protein